MLQLHNLSQSRKQLLLEVVRHAPQIFLVGALSAIILNDLVARIFSWSLFDSISAMRNLAAPLTIAAVVLFWRLLADIREDIAPLNRLAKEVVEVLPGEGGIPCSDLMRSRSQIDVLTLAGSVTVPLDDEQVVNALFDPKRMSRVRCLIANPFAPGIIDRYQRDEPIWKRTGIQAIENRLVWLFNLHERLDDGARARLNVAVYNSYPMLSIFRADDLVYSSYYAYQLRGHDTPMLLAGVASPYGKALMKHFDKLYEAATALPVWMERFYCQLRTQSECQFGLRYSGIFLLSADGKLIMQKREDRGDIAHPNCISVFGGRSQSAESARATAVRELREETGIRVREVELQSLITVPYIVNEGGLRCMLCSYFVLTNVAPEAVTVSEGAGKIILSAEEALERDDLTEVPRRILESRVESGSWPAGAPKGLAEAI